MTQILSSSPLLTVFLVIALGTLFGSIPFGPLKFGAAGALFVGLAAGALDPELGKNLSLISAIGLALFVYTIGLAAGASFFRDLRKQGPLLFGAVALLAAYALIVALGGKALGLDANLLGGMFAGSLTTTPALAAATDAAGGSAQPAVGYAIAYPVGVIVTMVVVTALMRIKLPANNDPDPASAAGLATQTIRVEKPMRIQEIPGIAEVVGSNEGELRVSYLLREGKMQVAHPDGSLKTGDLAFLVGLPDAVAAAGKALGKPIEGDISNDRTDVNFNRFTVSNSRLVGKPVANLFLPARFQSLLTRVRRGDTDMLATAGTRLQMGDRVLVVYPVEREEEIAKTFGDSEHKISAIDYLPFGLGIAAGVALGLITIPLGSLGSLALGAAAGPLVVGLILGRVDRLGPLVFSLAPSANNMLRQMGLVLFLAAVGLSSGQAFAAKAFSLTGVKIGLLAAVGMVPVLLALWLLGKVLGLSTARMAGAIAGFVGQPAILSHVQTTIPDERCESGYSATFALGIIAKIVLVQIVMVL
ncbi:aspartate:alanine exchanger family transporter [Varibaculum vaginae]|uniref:aspartate:alanine exchanger family transporter n=1 Tax=Varibaculum vaginae TaxID=2364797 RepID=UPI000F077F55|nr:TrkA C-terminal domain-containing protein [Varibaculum vaginae]